MPRRSSPPRSRSAAGPLRSCSATGALGERRVRRPRCPSRSAAGRRCKLGSGRKPSRRAGRWDRRRLGRGQRRARGPRRPPRRHSTLRASTRSTRRSCSCLNVRRLWRGGVRRAHESRAASAPAPARNSSPISPRRCRSRVGGRSYTIHLRPGIRYSDGTLLRAVDFRRALERVYFVDGFSAQSFSKIVGVADCERTPALRSLPRDDRHRPFDPDITVAALTRPCSTPRRLAPVPTGNTVQGRGDEADPLDRSSAIRELRIRTATDDRSQPPLSRLVARRPARAATQTRSSTASSSKTTRPQTGQRTTCSPGKLTCSPSGSPSLASRNSQPATRSRLHLVPQPATCSSS